MNVDYINYLRFIKEQDLKWSDINFLNHKNTREKDSEIRRIKGRVLMTESSKKHEEQDEDYDTGDTIDSLTNEAYFDDLIEDLDEENDGNQDWY
jgi:hypothetical protein